MKNNLNKVLKHYNDFVSDGNPLKLEGKQSQNGKNETYAIINKEGKELLVGSCMEEMTNELMMAGLIYLNHPEKFLSNLSWLNDKPEGK